MRTLRQEEVKSLGPGPQLRKGRAGGSVQSCLLAIPVPGCRVPQQAGGGLGRGAYPGLEPWAGVSYCETAASRGGIWAALQRGLCRFAGHRWGCGFSSAVAEDDGSCEVNGRLYQEGETFQPHCSIRCRCEDGGFTCVPLCSEDVRLPSWDCPYPRRVEVLGKCCPEWVCGQGGGLGAQPLPAQGERSAGPGQGQDCLGAPRATWGVRWGGASWVPGPRDTSEAGRGRG